MVETDSQLEEWLWSLAGISCYDDSTGSVDELDWYSRFDSELAVLHEDGLGFQEMIRFDTLVEMNEYWDSIVSMYDLYDGGEA